MRSHPSSSGHCKKTKKKKKNRRHQGELSGNLDTLSLSVEMALRVGGVSRGAAAFGKSWGKGNSVLHGEKPWSLPRSCA